VVTRVLADTSIFVARESGRALEDFLTPYELAVSIITIGELRAGVLAADDIQIRDLRLSTLSRAMSLDPISIDDRIAEQWARLRVLLRLAHKRMPVNDSWIAATAMAMEIPIVTQDDDFVKLEELSVIRV
jgi:predicted nucleic acid-binding protein